MVEVYQSSGALSIENFTFSRISFATKLYRPFLSQKYQFDISTSIVYSNEEEIKKITNWEE